VRRLASWLPVVAWMAAITWFSTAHFDAEQTASILRPLLQWLLPWASAGQITALHLLLRKGAHLTEYAILAALWLRALHRERIASRRAGLITLLACAAWAFVDELHQAFEPTRTASALDVLLDTAGAAAVVVVTGLGWRRVVDTATAALLWTAVIGGSLVLAVNAASGVGSGPLWITVPVAVVALVVRWRKSYSRS
jgi:VanZ family protein